MNFRNVWTITAKELGVLKSKKSLLYATFIVPFIIGIGLPSLIYYISTFRAIELLLPIINAFSFFYLVLSIVIPSSIAAYSLVGEKTEKSLEPLLATPTTDDEILLGKSLAAYIPVICTIFISAMIFMILMDIITFGHLGYLYFPNWKFGIIILLDTPLGCLMSIEFSIIISSRASDVRSAQQMSALIVIPFALSYVLIETSIITLDDNILLFIAGIIAIIDISLFFVSRALFQREEILTKWK